MTSEGTLINVDDRPALQFERRFRQPVDRVWRAISDPADMAQWFPSNVEGDRRAGAELRFVDDDQRAAAREVGEPTRADGPMFHGVVVVYDPPREFSFTWGGELLRFQLTADGDGTRLVFTHVLSHPSVAARNGAGWHYCLSALEEMLGSADQVAADGPYDGAAGLQLYYDYLDRVGPPLGVPSPTGAMTWERATHVDADRVRQATTTGAELDAWGAANRAGEPLHWKIDSVDNGTVFRLTHDAIGHDAELAATWHALLIQLDMYLAAGELIPVEAKRWIADYEAVL